MTSDRFAPRVTEAVVVENVRHRDRDLVLRRPDRTPPRGRDEEQRDAGPREELGRR